MTIHVCLVSNQPIPNLVPLLLEQPDRAVLLVSPQMRLQAERLERVLRPRAVACRQEEVDPYDFAAVAEVCKRLIRETDDELVLNVTGGTKVSALAAFQAFYFNDKRIIYLDTANNRLLDLAPTDISRPIGDNLVPVRDYLACYGLVMSSTGRPPAGHERRAPHLDALARLFEENDRLLGRWNSALEAAWNGRAGFANVSLNQLGEGAGELAELLEICGVASRGHGVINVHTEEHRFFCQGGWLEELVFREVGRLGLPSCRPAINVDLRWDEAGRRPTFNELDVVFTHANRLYIVSCKTSRLDRDQDGPGKKALYELDSLADKAGGLFGRAMLVSARRLSEADRNRARRMQIEVCDGRDLLRLRDRLRQWVRGGA